MKDQFQISEIAKAMGVPASTIRYYDKLGLIEPNVDPDSSYRYFNYTVAGNLQTVIKLRSIGVPIETIQEMFKCSDIQQLCMALLETNKQFLAQIEQLNAQQKSLWELFSFLKACSHEYDVIAIRQHPAWWFSYAGDTSNLCVLEEFNHLMNGGSMPTYCYSLPKEKLVTSTLEYDKYGFITDFPRESTRLSVIQLPPRNCVCYTYRGECRDSLQQAYTAISDWLSENHHSIVGDAIERYICGMHKCKIMELWVPIE